MKDKTVEAIETKRLILRGWTLKDAGDMYKYASNPNVGPHAGWKPHETIEESKLIIENLFLKKYHIWAICPKETNRVIGSIGYEEDQKRPGTGCMELGYALAEGHWGKGLMTEAARAVLRHGFEKMELPIVSIYCNPLNGRSGRVIEKCGFRFEGVLRQANKIDSGEIRDAACYSMTKAEWVGF